MSRSIWDGTSLQVSGGRFDSGLRLKMNKIPPSRYKKLSPGVRYTFKTYDLKGEHWREGLLISVTTKYQDKKDEDGKVVGRRLVGDQLMFEPTGDAGWIELFGERLKVYSTTVGRGLFEIFSD